MRRHGLTSTLIIAGCIAFILSLGVGCAQGDESDDYVGTWQISTGSLTFSCPWGSETTETHGLITYLAGNNGHLVRSDHNTACVFRFKQGDAGPTLLPGQACESSGVDEEGYYYTTKLQPMSWSLLRVDEHTMNETFSATYTVTYDGMAEICNMTVTQTLQKLGR